jgi:hypothetical protein
LARERIKEEGDKKYTTSTATPAARSSMGVSRIDGQPTLKGVEKPDLATSWDKNCLVPR